MYDFVFCHIDMFQFILQLQCSCSQAKTQMVQSVCFEHSKLGTDPPGDLCRPVFVSTQQHHLYSSSKYPWCASQSSRSGDCRDLPYWNTIKELVVTIHHSSLG